LQEINSKRKKLKFLVVDDNEYNIFGITTLLQQQDIGYDLCYDGQEAIDKIIEKNREHYTYDLILMDVNMPILNGLRVF
jgi:CheY-like chemotaxis protein